MYYVHKAGGRAKFIHQRIMDSWKPDRVLQLDEKDECVRCLPITSKMRFRSGCLLYSQSSGRLYLVSEGRLRQVMNPDTLGALGLSRNDAVWVSAEEIAIHQKGEPLN